MKTLLQYLGIFLVLCGVVCLVVYFLAVQSNTLLAASLVLEACGILGYIFINKYVQ